jgi:hypothetical protein
VLFYVFAPLRGKAIRIVPEFFDQALIFQIICQVLNVIATDERGFVVP